MGIYEKIAKRVLATESYINSHEELRHAVVHANAVHASVPASAARYEVSLRERDAANTANRRMDSLFDSANGRIDFAHKRVDDLRAENEALRRLLQLQWLIDMEIVHSDGAFKEYKIRSYETPYGVYEASP